MSGLYLPRHLRRERQAQQGAQSQMSQAIVFWFSKKLDHIMLPASPSCPAPSGYERIECRHAHEVETWSERLRQQEKRLREMTDEERYNFEEPIRTHGIEELKKALKLSLDPANRMFLARSIERLQQKREERRKEYVETYMHCEAKEGVAH